VILMVPCDDDCAMDMPHWHGMVLKIGVIGLLPKADNLDPAKNLAKFSVAA
jgi:hypothetical protein